MQYAVIHICSHTGLSSPLCNCAPYWFYVFIAQAYQITTCKYLSIWESRASRWVSKKKKVFKKAHFCRQKVKKAFPSPDLAMKICRKKQRYSLWSGLITSRQGFSQRFVFLSFFFLLENFHFGQDGTKWCDAPHRDVCGACERAFHAQLVIRGSSPGKFFCKYKLWEGHFRANLKATGKKGQKRLFTEIGK